MVFCSPLFLFLFLPVVLSVYLLLSGIRLRNFWLLGASIFFYAWGQVDFIALLLISTLINYLLGLWIELCLYPPRRKLIVALAVVINVSFLVLYKFSDLLVESVNTLCGFHGAAAIDLPHMPLPIGISFFTFHALSYVIDIYRRKWTAARDPRDAALYIFFFPQLIAGPILRWNAIAPQLLERRLRREVFAEGIRRFVGGLAKKMLIANTVALPADQIFALPASELTAATAWFGIVCYTLQIYFDFSGYSDMAVGLGKMFGFEFIENFNFPYTSQSIREFWRRWHISLSTWFRDYLYIPLGGNRVSETRNRLNLLLVFFLCGLWHGASWTFVIWGFYHGLFLVLERTRWSIVLGNFPRPLRHAYAVLIIMFGWVLFRANDFGAAREYFTALAGLAHRRFAQPLAHYLDNKTLWAIAAGVFFSFLPWNRVKEFFAHLISGLAERWASPLKDRSIKWPARLGAAVEFALIFAALLLSAAWLAGDTYNPFIYFRF